MRWLVCLLFVLAFSAAACAGDDDAKEPTVTDHSSLVPNGLAFTGGDVADGRPIDPTYTCDGSNLSPALDWQNVPAGAAELALVVDDPDAPSGTFTHWVVYAIPPDYVHLDRGVPPGPVVSGAVSLRQGPSDGSDLPRYFGPCPPAGETHGYVFTLYALDEETGLDGGASIDDLRAAMDGHIVAEATLTAPYARSSG